MPMMSLVRPVVLALATAGTSACTASRSPAAPAPAPESAAVPVAGADSAPRPERWQILLNSGAYLYEVRLVGARGDTLLAAQPDSALAVPLAAIDELRLVQASVKAVGGGGGGRATFGGLVGADDLAYKLSRFSPDERRRIVTQLLRERGVTGGP